MLKINVLVLKEGEYFFDYALRPSEVELEEDYFKNDINVDVALVKNVYQIELKVKFNTVLVFECDRCLDNYEHLCKGSFELYFKPMPLRNQEVNEEKDEDNIRFYSVVNKYIDITKDLRDYIMLSVPMRHVPEEKDGVCVVCKRNFDEILNQKNSQRDINPVWKKLFEKDN